MKLTKSKRSNVKMKMALQGSAGSGKTWSSLLLSKGLSQGDMSKVAVIDTENGSSNLYSSLGEFNVLNLKAPHTPEKYVEALKTCENAGMQVIIVDSISHCWDYLLEYHSSLSGNSFTNWAKVTPRQKAFVQKILESSAHVICTMRTKQDYVLNQKDGKYVPEKVGLKAIQRDGVDYEFTIVIDIDIKHNATSSKDRTGLFMDKPQFKISPSTGEQILKWCSQTDTVDFTKRVGECKSMKELVELFDSHPEKQEAHRVDFVIQKSLLSNNTNHNNHRNNETN